MDNLINPIRLNVQNGFILDKYNIKSVSVENTASSTYGASVTWDVPSGAKLLAVVSRPSNVTSYAGYNNIKATINGAEVNLSGDNSYHHFGSGAIWSQLGDSRYANSVVTKIKGEASRDDRGTLTARLSIIYAEPKAV